jgi:hypothetical protein
MVNRTHVRRLGSLVVALALGAVTVGTVSAGNTRILYVGDPAGGTANDGHINLAPANVGTTTVTQVLIQNNGKQNLTKGGFGIGTVIAGLPDAFGNNGQALPDGWLVEAISSTAGTCTIVDAGRGASCDLGTLNKGAKRVVTLYLFAASTADSIQVMGRVAENQGGNVGSNSNTFFASSTTGTITEATQGQIIGYFKGGKVKPLTPGTTRTEIDLGANGAFLPVTINDNASEPCPPGITCLPGTSRANVNNGGSVSPAFVWTAYFPVAANASVKNTTTLYHFFDDGTFETITAKTGSCSKGKVPCADFSIVTIGSQTYLQVIFQTTRNGYIKTR